MKSQFNDLEDFKNDFAMNRPENISDDANPAPKTSRKFIEGIAWGVGAIIGIFLIPPFISFLFNILKFAFIYIYTGIDGQ